MKVTRRNTGVLMRAATPGRGAMPGRRGMRKIGVMLRGLGAVWLLLLFAFSITPRKTLHDFLAHHQDSFLQADDQDGGRGALHIHKSGYHCHCDSLVVESPFLAGAPAPVPDVPVKDFVLLSGTISSSYRVPVLLTLPRGPPSSAVCA